MTVGFECVGDCRVATHFRRVEYANKPKLFAGVKELQTEWNGRTRIKMRTKSDFCVLLLQLTLAATRLLWNDSLLLLISDLKCLVRESRALLFRSISRGTSCGPLAAVDFTADLLPSPSSLLTLFSIPCRVCAPSDAKGAIHHARPWQDARRI